MSGQPRARMHVTPEQLAGVIEFSGYSLRGLAEAVTDDLRKDKKKPRIGCSHTTLSNLTTGKSQWIYPRRAAAIERCLRVPRGHLFMIQLFNVPSNKGTAA